MPSCQIGSLPMTTRRSSSSVMHVSRCAGPPRSRIASSAAFPMNSVSQSTANPRPAAIGSCSVSMSWPHSR